MFLPAHDALSMFDAFFFSRCDDALLGKMVQVRNRDVIYTSLRRSFAFTKFPDISVSKARFQYSYG